MFKFCFGHEKKHPELTDLKPLREYFWMFFQELFQATIFSGENIVQIGSRLGVHFFIASTLEKVISCSENQIEAIC